MLSNLSEVWSLILDSFFNNLKTPFNYKAYAGLNKRMICEKLIGNDMEEVGVYFKTLLNHFSLKGLTRNTSVRIVLLWTQIWTRELSCAMEKFWPLNNKVGSLLLVAFILQICLLKKVPAATWEFHTCAFFILKLLIFLSIMFNFQNKYSLWIQYRAALVEHLFSFRS